MRNIDQIIIHCSATPAGHEVSVAEIDAWHRAAGYTRIGYHYVIHLDGTISAGRPEEEIGAHCRGHNAHSIGICYIGGCDTDMRPADTRTPQQRRALAGLIDRLRSRYPNASVHGHCEFSSKACPCFDVRAEFAMQRQETRQ